MHICVSSALLPNNMVMFEPELQLKATSGSMTLLQLWSMLVSEAPVTIEGHADA